MDIELAKAIYDRFAATSVSSDVAQAGDLTEGIFFGMAPAEKDARMPYVVVYPISTVPVSTFDDDAMTECIVQFSIYSDSRSLTEVGTIRNHLVEAFDRATLTYATKSHRGCLRVAETGPIRFEDCWQQTVDYRIHYA